jgi:hypothetical protein
MSRGGCPGSTSNEIARIATCQDFTTNGRSILAIFGNTGDYGNLRILVLLEKTAQCLAFTQN